MKWKDIIADKLAECIVIAVLMMPLYAAVAYGAHKLCPEYATEIILGWVFYVLLVWLGAAK